MENFRSKKVAYYCINDPRDKRSWSGITFYMGQALEKYYTDVDFLGPVRIPWILDKTFRAFQKISRLLFGTEWIPKYSLLKNFYAKVVLTRKMKGTKYDFLIAPAAASELAYLKTTVPVIYYGDATYKIYSETYHFEFRNLNKFSRWEGNHLEYKALTKSDLIIFSSQWAVNSAVKDYGISPEKIEVIQMGANIDEIPSPENIYDKEHNTQIILLFLSVDWARKGGNIAFDALQQLILLGVDAKLIICGCIPPSEFTHPLMEIIPFLNKNDRKDLERFQQLMSEVNFLLLPTRADCTPLVNCEANAYGVPAITTDVGGITEAVKDGINGYCLPLQAPGSDYAKLIKEIFSDKTRYHELIRTSRKMFDLELNWKKFVENFDRLLVKHKIY